jgi:geranylgeranyl pyrophosphate synthase
MDLEKQGGSLSFEEYAQLCSGKTGAMFQSAWPARPAGIAARCKAFDCLRDAGTRLGELFQRRDDIVDILGKKEGRTEGSELHTGRATCLVAHAARMCRARPGNIFCFAFTK